MGAKTREAFSGKVWDPSMEGQGGVSEYPPINSTEGHTFPSGVKQRMAIEVLAFKKSGASKKTGHRPPQ